MESQKLIKNIYDYFINLLKFDEHLVCVFAYYKTSSENIQMWSLSFKGRTETQPTTISQPLFLDLYPCVLRPKCGKMSVNDVIKFNYMITDWVSQEVNSEGENIA